MERSRVGRPLPEVTVLVGGAVVVVLGLGLLDLLTVGVLVIGF